MSLVANVQNEPTELKTERNKSRGFGLMCLHCLVETVYATMSGPVLFAFVNAAAILGEQRSPDISKLMRGKGDNILSVNKEGAKIVTGLREGRGIESLLLSDIPVMVDDSKGPEFNNGRDSNGTVKRTKVLLFCLAGVPVVVVVSVSCIVMSPTSASGNSHIFARL